MQLLLPIIFGVIRWMDFYGLSLMFLIGMAFRVYAIVDGVVHARKQREYFPKRYNTWYYHLLIAVVMVVILSCYDQKVFTGIQAFRIDTSSDAPTVQVGDPLIADMNIQ